MKQPLLSFYRIGRKELILKAISAVKFLSIPLVYLWKFTVIAFVIWVGCFMFGYRVTYSQCWGVVIGAEYIFLFLKF